MHIALQNDLYLFQVSHTEFQSKRNRDELAAQSKINIKDTKNDFASFLQKQLNQSTV